MSTTIYALCAPDTGEIRYIGKTVKPALRFAAHLGEAARGHTCYRCNWIRSLASRPTMRPLFIVPDHFGGEAEVATIGRLRALGYRLMNRTDGGDGCVGLERTPEHCAHIGAAQRGRKRPAEVGRKISARLSGRKASPQQAEVLRAFAARNADRNRSEKQRAALSAAFTGKAKTAEHRARLSAAKLGKPASSTAREAMRLAGLKRRGQKKSPETRARLAAAMRARWADARGRAVLLEAFKNRGKGVA